MDKKKIFKLSLALSLALSHASLMNAAEPAQQVKDSEAATFTNPVLWADLPDPDVIRVGDYFYMMSTTMHLMPGAPVMRSKDLINWELTGYVFDKLHETPKYDMEDGTVYGRGQWATSLRYHDGKFYVLFSPNDQPFRSFIYTTEDPMKGWTLHSRMKHFHDSSLFFEDDGTPFIITFKGEIIELDKDLAIKNRNFGKLNMNIEQDVQCEGCQFFKVDGKYYAFFMYRPGGIRKVLCLKSNSLTGNYSQRVVLDDSGIAQGGIIDTPDGKWYGYFFQDIWPLGRCPYLVPCTWDDGWPVMGDENGDVPREMEVPVNTGNLFPRSEVLVNDDFDSEKLGLTWQWNHNPDNSLWSLKKRRGYMRLMTGRVMEDPTDIFHARNTLTQRVLNGTCSGRIAIDVSNMKNGDRAGLSAFNYYGGLIEVIKENNSYKLSMATYNQKRINEEENNERVEMGEDISFSQDVVYLRTDLNYTSNKATFYYSLDGYTWNQLGGETTLIYTLKHFTGYRFGIFNYATHSSGGYVDIDYFEYKKL